MKLYLSIPAIFFLTVTHAQTTALSSGKLSLFKFSSIAALYEVWNVSGYSTPDLMSSHAKNTSDLVPIAIDNYSKGAILINPFVIAQGSPNSPENFSNKIASSGYHVQAGLSVLSPGKHRYQDQQELILGLIYRPSIYHKANFIRLDTLSTDSLVVDYAYYSETSHAIGLEGSYIFKTNPKKTISVFLGAGGLIETTINPLISENYGTFFEISPLDSTFFGNRQVIEYGSISNVNKQVSAQHSFILEARIPAGITVRIIHGLQFLLNANAIFGQQIFLKGNSYPVYSGVSLSGGLKYQF